MGDTTSTVAIAEKVIRRPTMTVVAGDEVK
jgi:hypothetical protein